MALRFIFSYPETNGTEADMLDAGPVPEVAAAAERAGFAALSLTEHPIPGARWLQAGGHQSLDPIVALAAAAAATTRLRLLTHLVVGPYRNPFLLAKAAATLDRVSDGRFTLGLGVGYHKAEFFALGVDHDERNVLFDELLDCLPLHWRGEAFSYTGSHFDARNVQARPRPVQDPVPIWLGGNSALSRRRVARRAQGWMPMPGGPERARTARTTMIGGLDDLGSAVAEVRGMAADHGRDDHIDVAYGYGDISVDDPSADADRHHEAFAAIEAAGVDWLVVSSHAVSAAATAELVEGFGATYIG